MTNDLILRGGHVVDPSQKLDGVMDVAFSGGKVAAVGRDLRTHEGATVVDAGGCIVTPGLIDLHTHVYDGGTSLGVDAMRLFREGAVTTLVDTGSAGPGNFKGFREHVIERAPVRIIAYLNISFAGIYGFSKRVMVGESGDMRLMAPIDTVEVARANRDVIAGVKVRVGRNASGFSGLAPLDIARQAAEEIGMPMMVHIDEPPPMLPDVLARLRKGDILTHCFRPFPNCAAGPDGKVLDCVLDARARGVIFDIGHGMGSFSFAVARTMLANGFKPDCISSDVHALCIEGPAFDLLTTMSKFLCLGMPLAEVVEAATLAPARALGREELGTFAPGSPGDASLLKLDSGRFDYVDSVGERLVGEQRLSAAGVVFGGVHHAAGRAR
ncbi:amidohydrolase/deacetylase family metallohydrolase [Alsobacter sp. SYSU M60028]|uniref:Amidohydrolase/deacetylase family metallohydrolase n=1 Tax=Alsobacter ponti TaxID=2962936 RepID=A0ABT1L6R7_9HYPH|nr:amidohydrolase/deacetylase family metallohydrolase [Alsobacter ponti]MCP8937109.1 amidohydrolase/deacetylase family metallohydrolase [Alsobacter ponti]